jgi:hypothetical protein
MDGCHFLNLYSRKENMYSRIMIHIKKKSDPGSRHN